MNRIDRYIIRKFLGTFTVCIVLVMSIAIVFDMTEKLDNFFEAQLTWNDIFWEYYINFIPYYLNMFVSLFIFISVIFFTSKMAGNSEIIAILAAGMSYRRLMRPYFFCATIMALFTFWMSGYVIPPASEKLLLFQDKYVEHFTRDNGRNIQMQVSPGTVLYMETFQLRTKIGYRVSLDHFEGKSLQSRLTADRIRYIDGHQWYLENYTRRDFEDLHETLTRGAGDTITLPIVPDEMFFTAQHAEMMTNPELTHYIERQRERGAHNVLAFETQYHKRWAAALGAFIMTLLGVTLSSKKVRGGMGKNLGIGIVLTAAYILFSTVSTTFAVKGVMSAFMAAWLPNIIFLAIGLHLYRKVSR